MRSEYRQWTDAMEIQWRVASGVARVIFPLFGGNRVQNDDGSLTPQEFTYVETPDNASAPFFVMECEYTESDLIPRIIAFQVIQRDPQREVRSVDLRSVRLEEALEAAWLKATRRPVTVQDDSAPATTRLAQPQTETDLRKTLRGLRAGSRRRLTDQILQQVADVYRAAEPGGAPTKAVKEHFGLAPSTASMYVKKARDGGFLPDRS